MNAALAGLLSAALLCAMAAGHASGLVSAPAAAPASTPSGTSATMAGGAPSRGVEAMAEAQLLAVRLNGVEQIEPVRALRLANTLALAAADWRALNFDQRGAEALVHEGERYHRLDALPGLLWQIDTATQTLEIEAPPAAFGRQHLATGSGPALAEPVDAWGSFLNYDINMLRSSANRATQAASDAGGSAVHATQALLDLGLFGPPGQARVSGVVRNSGGPRWVRLDSTWTQDRPAQRDSLRIGDAISQPGAWGRAQRFGGVQWATDFSVQPGFLSFPLPAMRGDATLPSTVDVYVNNTRRLHGEVPAGSFELNDVPIVTGAGQVRMVVRDMLGREQVVVQPYYVSPSLLKPGLRAFSFELGAVRKDYGLASNNYGRMLASATERRGISEHFTGELHAEVSGSELAAGLSGLWLQPALGQFSLSAAGSHGPGGSGGLLVAAAERQSVDWSGNVQWRRSSRGFNQPGQTPGTGTREALSLALGRTLGGFSIGASVVQLQAWNGPQQRLMSANVSRQIGSFGALALFAQRDASSGQHTVSLSFSMTLDSRSAAMINSARSGSRQSSMVQVQRNPEEELGGVALQLAAETSRDRDAPSASHGGPRVQAQAVMRTERAEWQASAARHGHQGSEWRLGASGSLAMLDGSVFAGRRIDGSFAVVSVGDYADVRVLHDNRPVARTNERGLAMLAGLRSYDRNRISVDASDLPFDAEVQALEQQVVPPSRSGMLVRIPVQRSRSASFRLVDARGQAVPPRAQLMIGGSDASYPVGYDGRAFAAGLSARTPLLVRWPGGSCRADLHLTGTFDDLPDLGTVVCE